MVTQAEVCQGLKQYEQADSLFARAQAIHEKSVGPNHPATVAILKKRATLLRQTHHNKEAMQLEAQAEAIPGIQQQTE